MGQRSCKPLVSVILPAWNAAAYLEESLHSVFSQTYENWELIVINDGSTDSTGALLDGLSDPRVCVIHREHSGVSAARNRGLDMARGEFIAFLDADDLLPPDSIRVRSTHLLNHPKADIVDGVILVRDESMSRVVRRRLPGEGGAFFPRLIRLSEEVFFGPFYMVRTAALGHTRFREDLTHVEDLVFFLEAADNRELAYASIADEVYVYRKTGSSAMSNLTGIESGYLRLFEVAQGLSAATPEDIDYLYHRIRRILTRSWIRRFQPFRAVKAWAGLEAMYRTHRPPPQGNE